MLAAVLGATMISLFLVCTSLVLFTGYRGAARGMLAWLPAGFAVCTGCQHCSTPWCFAMRLFAGHGRLLLAQNNVAEVASTLHAEQRAIDEPAGLLVAVETSML